MFTVIILNTGNARRFLRSPWLDRGRPDSSCLDFRSGLSSEEVAELIEGRDPRSYLVFHYEDATESIIQDKLGNQ
jgi:hypothetical protein